MSKTNTPSRPLLKGENLPNKGTYKFTVATNVRTKPGLGHSVVAVYHSGDTITYIGKVIADGYVWLKYISGSGKVRYVAVV
ncbi:SH3 domain-containing protein [Enterococcus saccharolyticus]|uniref:SH3b domain-containing protein n=1 Tax=Enterococcus saccharolyticus subsp. saccharolyticus ATCC 43076 TaxID=1139996 RepID=S0NI14_9ENTE|nr:SH3 domain-containing protein [Enterococcus saccharolyticus]EOT29694.1 hypothetical protein OMQ_01007 [Enterococcus saccharolyticus subsp. saccharolyticus ATCC 43076]EOT80854.1 hypothetical protein I572_01386 [Enterococcus saccharolyticus subsp. saccharolyticus ATCC 43076]